MKLIFKQSIPVLYCFICLLATIFSACAPTPHILVSNELKSGTTVMDASGRQGKQFKQVIRYGNYYTDQVKRGWTTGSELTFVLRFQKAKQKLSFTQFTPYNKRALVLAVSHFSSTELALLDGYLFYKLDCKNTYAGSIIPGDDVKNAWDFILYDLDAGYKGEGDCGLISNNKGKMINIRAVNKMEGLKNWPAWDNYGYEFYANGKAIAAVSLMDKGRVWIKDSISVEEKLLVSSVSTSLLLRHSTSDRVGPID